MSTKLTLHDSPDLLAPAGCYSHVAVHGGLAFISGQLPVADDGTVLADRSFVEQSRQVLDNLDACLRTVGAARDHLVSVTVYVTEIGQWSTFDDLYRGWIGAHRPSRAVADVAQLHHGAAVEVQAVAAVG